MEQQILAMLLGWLTIIGCLVLSVLSAKPMMAFIQRCYPDFYNTRDLLWLWYGLGIGAFVLGLLVMYGLCHG